VSQSKVDISQDLKTLGLKACQSWNIDRKQWMENGNKPYFPSHSPVDGALNWKGAGVTTPEQYEQTGSRQLKKHLRVENNPCSKTWRNSKTIWRKVKEKKKEALGKIGFLRNGENRYKKAWRSSRDD